MPELFDTISESRYAAAAALVVASILGAYAVAFLIEKTLVVLARRTTTDLDDHIVEALRKPIAISVMLLGLGVAISILPAPAPLKRISNSVLESLAIIVWVIGGFSVLHAALHHLSRGATESSFIQKRTLPVFDMVGKALIIGAGVYFLFLAWDIDLTAWLASAGVVGIAVGFAAKDTLANLFSGIFIIADAPYKIGDVIVLDDGLRGQVTSIGIRSTRVLTRDDIEITIPNAVIGASKIVNEAGGPATYQRVGVTVDAAYGADIDRVHEVLLSASEGVANVLKRPSPCVRFRAFGASGLTHVLYVWIHDPRDRELVEHQLHTNIYRAFGEAGLEIPFSKHDVYIKEQPEAPLRVIGASKGG